MANSCDFRQDVFVLDLSAASTATYPEGLRISAPDWNSYIAGFSDEAEVTIRVGSLDAIPYNLYVIPVRKTRAPFGEVWISWAAQAGVSLTFILGIDENAGVR